MSHAYKLFSYRAGSGEARSGIGVGEQAYDLQRCLKGRATLQDAESLLSVLDQWSRAAPILQLLADTLLDGGVAASDQWPIQSTSFLPPLLYPNAVYCAGANYTDHVAEMERAFNLPHEDDPHLIGQPPWHFIKAARQSFIGHGSNVPLPAYSKTVDWEAEVGLVIGRAAKDVPIENAMNHVAGYTILNDLSARDHLRRLHAAPGSPFEYDWIGQKNFDHSCPIGPWIVPAGAIPDPKNLAIRLWVNEELMQDSNTSRMIFDYAEQIAHLSQRLTLFPGDIIATGTPAGVGLPRKRFLQPGDQVRIEVEHIGVLSHRMVAPQ